MTRHLHNGTLESNRPITENEAVYINRLLDSGLLDSGLFDSAKVAEPNSEYLIFNDFDEDTGEMIESLQKIVKYLQPHKTTLSGSIYYQGVFDGTYDEIVVENGTVRKRSPLENFSTEELVEELRRRHYAV